MNVHNLMDMIGESPDEYLQEAKQKPKKHRIPSWTKWGSAIAACLVLVVAAVSLPGLFDGGVANDTAGLEAEVEKGESAETTESGFEYTDTAEEPTAGMAGSEMAIETDMVTIHYVDGNAVITTQSELPLTAEDVFNAWKKANGIGDEVQLLSCKIDDNSTTTTHGSGADAVVEHKVGDYFILNLTVSSEIESYYGEIPEELLLSSLEQTMTGYSNIDFDEYHLILE